MNDTTKSANLVNYLKFNSIAARQNRKLDRNLSVVHGIGITEFLVLHTLHQAAKHTMSRIELATEVGMSASGVTRMLNPMEKIGLVEKQKQARDARISLVGLTAAGLRTYREALTTASQVSDAFYAALTGPQVKKLDSILTTLG